MNVSYRWLLDMVPGLKLSPADLAEHLALRGAPVEGIVAPGAGLRDVVVGRVLTAGPHPNADRLSLCTVDGGDGVVSVVCGAPNVKGGAWYPFAPVGAVLPGDFKIKKAKIRGEVSEGMLCSPSELGIGDDHSGILEISGDFTPGQSFVEALGLDDATLDVEITANRGDLLSHMGVARELASEGGGQARLAEIPGDPALTLEHETHQEQVAHGEVSIRIEAPDLCPRYLGVVIRDVTVGPSPAWLQERLRGAGSRPINNVVDATNYVMMELGQPLHAFDLNKLRGSSIVVRRASAEENSFTTLDGEDRKITPDMLMICDADRPVAIAGVMGGQDSEVDESTSDVLLECALFDTKSIRATRRDLIMSTDASYRFERGVDPEGMALALQRAVSLIVLTAGGEVDGPVLDVCPRAWAASNVDLRLSRIERLLGLPMSSAQVRGYLEPLGFEVTGEDDGVMHVRVPGFRSYDVTREVDLIEEVARTHGYDEFPSALGPFRQGTVPDDPLFALEDELRDMLVGEGLFETQTPAFVSESEGDVRVSNPLNTREPYIRRVLLPSILRRVEYNFAREARDIRLFELGTSFRTAGVGAPPREETHLAVALTGRRAPAHWSEDSRGYSVWEIKGLAERMAGKAYRGRATVEPAAEANGLFAPAASFVIRGPGGDEVGKAGLVAEGVVDAPVWAGPVWGIELTLPADVPDQPPVTYQPLPQFPSSERDLALLVPMETAAQRVLGLISDRAGDLLESVDVFDLYEGEGLGEGVRSIAVRLRFRASDRTLKDKEVDRVVKQVLVRLKEELGVEHRG
jgi:phenylalanyl-tRNA synthetase beta chain